MKRGGVWPGPFPRQPAVAALVHKGEAPCPGWNGRQAPPDRISLKNSAVRKEFESPALETLREPQSKSLHMNLSGLK